MTVTEWGVRFTWADGHRTVTAYESEQDAREIAEQDANLCCDDLAAEVVSRQVSEWEPAATGVSPRP